MLEIKPISLSDANAFVAQNHRHHSPVQGHKFSLAVYDGDKLCGVAITGRPVSRALDDGYTLEVTRLCTNGTYNACSMLYSRCARIAKLMGYTRIITYILASESGTSLKASGWMLDESDCGGGSWDTKTRPRETEQISLFGTVRKYPTEEKKRYAKKLS